MSSARPIATPSTRGARARQERRRTSTAARSVLLGLVLALTQVTQIQPASAAHGVSVEAFVEIGGTAAAPTATLTLENAWTSSDSLSNVRIRNPNGTELAITPTMTSTTTTVGSIFVTRQIFTFALPTSGTAGRYEIGMTQSACGCRAAAFNVLSNANVSFQTGFFYDPAVPLAHAGSPKFNAALLRNLPGGQAFTQDLGGFSPNGHALRYSFIEDTRIISGTDRILRDGAPVTLAGLAANKAASSTQERDWTAGANGLNADLASISATGVLSIPAATTSAVLAQSQSRLSIKILIEEVATVAGNEVVLGFATRDIGFVIVASSNVAPVLSATVGGAALPAGGVVVTPGQTVDVVIVATDLDNAGQQSNQSVTIATQNLPPWASVLTPSPDATNPRTRTIRLAPKPSDAPGTRTIIVTATDNDATFPLSSQLLVAVELTTAPTLTLGDRSITATWTPIDGADGYRVRYRIVGSGEEGWIVSAQLPGQATSTRTIEGLTVGSTYEVQFAAYTLDNGSETLGVWSKSATTTVLSVTGIATTSGDVRLSGASTVIDGDLTLSGSDTLSGATVVVDNRVAGDTLACTSRPASITSCSYSAATGVLTLSGDASTADYRTALRGVTFATTSADTTPRVIRYSLAGTAVFVEATGNYYEWVTAAAISWTNAKAHAEDRANYGQPGRPKGMAGLQGYLVTVTSQAENDALRSRLAGQGWMGASDALNDKQWRWVTGPEGLEDSGKGRWFYTQAGYNASGPNTCGTGPAASALQPKDGSGDLYFSNWASGEPNDFPGGCAGGEDYAHFLGNGSWNDYPIQLSNIAGYVVEYGGMPGDPVLPAPLTATRTVVPLPLQTITPGIAVGATFTYGETFTFSPTASSGLPVSVSLSGTGCALDDLGAGQKSLDWTAAGNCTITLERAGVDADAADGGFRAATTITRTVTTARRPLSVSGLSATARVYDGTSAVTIAGAATIVAGGVLDADAGQVDLTGAPLGTLTSGATVGSARAVSVTGLSLSGTRAERYSIAPTLTVDIVRRPVGVTGSFTVSDRAYDTTSSAVIATSSFVTESASDGRGRVAGDTLTLSGPLAGADDALPGTRTATLVTITLGGAAAANYELDLTSAPTSTFAITAARLTVSGSFSVADKVYDGTAAATVLTQDLTLQGFVGGDTDSDVTLMPTAEFAITSAGTGRTVRLRGGAVLSGPRGGAYTLDLTDAPSTLAAITPRPVTVTGAAGAPRPYDGTSTVTITGATLANAVPGDALTLVGAAAGTASSPNAGTQPVATSMSLAGTDAANYVLTAQPAVNVLISPLPLAVSMNALPARVYDRTTSLTLAPGAFSITGTLPSEVVNASGTGVLSSRAVGTRTVALTPTFTGGPGVSLTNYVVPALVTGTVTITPRPLRIAGARVTSRAYDATRSATVSGATLEGLLPGDLVSLSSATGVFASAEPGTHSVAFTPTLAGLDAGNYTLSVPPLTGSITRSSAVLRITAGTTQVADGTPRTVRAAVSPADAGRIVISYPGGSAPTAPGTYTLSVRLDSTTHEAAPLTTTMTIERVETFLTFGTTGTTGTTGDTTQQDEQRTAELIARIAVRSDGTLAPPEIGPVLNEDGSTPTLAPRDHRILRDGEASEARITVIDELKVRVENDSDDPFTIDLQAASDGRAPLPVDADGTLLLDRGGFVNVNGNGFLPGSTAEVWMFSTATFLGTVVVLADGTFRGTFPVDRTLTSGEHTIQFNGIAPDQSVRSASLGVRIRDQEGPARERVVLVTSDGARGPGGVRLAWLLFGAIVVGATTNRWWVTVKNRRMDAEASAEPNAVRV